MYVLQKIKYEEDKFFCLAAAKTKEKLIEKLKNNYTDNYEEIMGKAKILEIPGKFTKVHVLEIVVFYEDEEFPLLEDIYYESSKKDIITSAITIFIEMSADDSNESIKDMIRRLKETGRSRIPHTRLYRGRKIDSVFKIYEMEK